MTGYEMIDIIMSRFEQMTEQASLYVALVSGYLITAYVVGARLSLLHRELTWTWCLTTYMGSIHAVSRVTGRPGNSGGA